MNLSQMQITYSRIKFLLKSISAINSLKGECHKNFTLDILMNHLS
jgi:hypothetical protein